MKRTVAGGLVLAAMTCAAPAFAGGVLEQIDITGNVPSPIPGHVVGRLVPIFWDSRCLPVGYSMNTTLDPIPNPLGAPFLTLADATGAFDSALASWTTIPTSYIDMAITGAVANAGLRGFDFKNELTFRTAGGFSAIASSPSTSLIEDSTFTHGLDIDGDGDPDVSNTLTSCGDADGDGDFELPPGVYRAGTILDNDVQFNTKASNGLRFTVLAGDADTVTRSVDLEGVAVHEFGHSLGLSHTLNNNKSSSDGNGATMFPFIDTGDPAAELAQRSLDSDDVAWASFRYREGSAASGPAALQAGDLAFDEAFGVIRGEVTHGVLGGGVAGASVGAYDKHDGVLESTGLSGTAQVSVSPTGGLFLVDAAFNILDGNYEIPARKDNYEVHLEAMDATPVPAANVSLTGQIGGLFGQLNFHEEYWNHNKEGAIEVRTGEAKNVHVNEGKSKDGVDFVTNDEITIANFGNRNFVGFTLSPGGRIYAVRIPASQVEAILPGEAIYIHAALFDTVLADASTVPTFAMAALATGSVSGSTAAIDLDDPLASADGFLGQDNDLAPLYFKNPHELGNRVRADINDGDITDLFLVLQLPPSPFPGVSGLPPFIGLDGGVTPNDVPIFGFSYISDDGGVTFTQVTNFNFRFGLAVSAAE
jgi:hypothetical protein